MSPTPPAEGRRISSAGFDVTPLDKATVKELASHLDAEAYRVTQNAGTEPAFCGTLLDNKKSGTYACIVCGLPLFSSSNKFDSGTGWPSFYQPTDKDHIAYIEDVSHGMKRTEIECARCTAHLGHVFEDGPKPTGLRYCLNGAALAFHDEGKLPADKFTSPSAIASGATASATAIATGATTGASGAAAAPRELQTAYFAGGCFWGVEHWYEQCPGVEDAVSGFMGGTTASPTYEEVCSGTSGHTETVKVVFDPSKVSYKQLVDGFFIMHDPTQLNRQGPDVGSQYRSAVFCTSPEQEAVVRATIKDLSAARAFGGKAIVTQIAQGSDFVAAEDYHQDYVSKTGRACHVTNPWPIVFGKQGETSGQPSSKGGAH